MRNARIAIVLAPIIILLFVLINSSSFAVEGVLETQGSDLMTEKPENYPVATVAGGCFWCVESEFRALDGVLFTQVGYTGGELPNPTYQDITTGKTGHAEAVQISYDPEKISYEDLIRFFLTKAHDPTQINRQGVDVGTQYRSHIFYHNEEQKKAAESVINQLNSEGYFGAPIATKLGPAEKFWNGETYHQQYYEKYEKEKGEIHPRVYFKRQAKKLKGM